MKQQREILRKEKETAEKIAARAFAQSYLADLVPSVFGTLSDNGYFYDPVERGNENRKVLVWKGVAKCKVEINVKKKWYEMLKEVYRYTLLLMSNNMVIFDHLLEMSTIHKLK